MSPDLTTRYLGLELKNPLVAAACPLTGQVETLRRLQDAGAAEVVLPSLFEKQLEHDQMAIFRYYDGPEHVRTLPEGVEAWLVRKDYHSIAEIKGCLSQVDAPDPEAFERASYLKTLVHFHAPEASS